MIIKKFLDILSSTCIAHLQMLFVVIFMYVKMICAAFICNRKLKNFLSWLRILMMLYFFFLCLWTDHCCYAFLKTLKYQMNEWLNDTCKFQEMKWSVILLLFCILIFFVEPPHSNLIHSSKFSNAFIKLDSMSNSMFILKIWIHTYKRDLTI